ncbi:MAG: hypothetical protein M3R52_09035, partial [Acidobacteriota bacterium]|nr:hypothetical protein [Acidobacteriota bacterium]
MKKRPTNSLFLAFLLSSGIFAASAFTASAQPTNPQGAATPSAVAASTPGAAASPAPASTPPASLAPAPSPKVTGITGHLELDDIVRVEVEHFTEWAATHDATKLVPFINGRAIRGNYPEEIHPDQNRLHFHLEITAANKEVWTDLLGEPHNASRPVTFSIGLENQSPFDSVFGETNQVPLTVISPAYGVIALLVVLFTLILFLWLSRKTNIIREPGPNPGGGKLKPYNLGRTQMAFWFFLVYVSYLVIWLITDALDTITPSLLGLMGISAGTALSEALIDSGKDTAQGGRLLDLTAEKQTLEQSIAQLESQLAALNSQTTAAPEDAANRDSLNKQLQNIRTRLAQVSQQLQVLTPASSSSVSRGFLQD